MSTYKAKFIVKDDKDPQNLLENASVGVSSTLLHNLEYNGTNGKDGSVQQVTLQAGMYFLKGWGAAGGGSHGRNGGLAQGIIEITEETTAYIYVGGRPDATGTPGGYNGGGSGAYGAGGGATDFRIGGTDLTDRILVAAGGGAGSSTSYRGGHGGGETGERGGNSGGWGGTQTAGGSGNPSGTWGQGGNGGSVRNGGGGGWYGGGAGQYSGGGGGSSYIGRELEGADMAVVGSEHSFPKVPIIGGQTEMGVRSGHGLAEIWEVETKLTDVNGEAEFLDIPPGNYLFTVELERHVTYIGETEIVSADITENVTLTTYKVHSTSSFLQVDCSEPPDETLLYLTSALLQVEVGEWYPQPRPIRTRPRIPASRTIPLNPASRTGTEPEYG